jgi:hypothetical protein
MNRGSTGDTEIPVSADRREHQRKFIVRFLAALRKLRTRNFALPGNLSRRVVLPQDCWISVNPDTSRSWALNDKRAARRRRAFVT